jgi:hypothetical protein
MVVSKDFLGLSSLNVLFYDENTNNSLRTCPWRTGAPLTEAENMRAEQDWSESRLGRSEFDIGRIAFAFITSNQVYDACSLSFEEPRKVDPVSKSISSRETDRWNIF